MNEAHLIFCNSDEWAAAVKTWIIPGATNGVTLGDHVLEVGPGPGRTTDILKDMTAKLTAVEVDPMLPVLYEGVHAPHLRLVDGRYP